MYDLDAIIKRATAIAEAVGTTLPNHSQFQAIVDAVQKAALPSFLHGSEASDFIRQMEERQERERQALVDSGWWFTPSILEISARKLNLAVHAYHRGNRQAIFQLFRSFYQKNHWRNLQLTVQQWGDNHYFKPWQEHIHDAMSAHIDKKYTLSIPVLLLVSEGIATDFCNRNNISFSQSKGDEKIKKALSRTYADTDNLLFNRLDILTYSIDQIIYKNTSALGPMLSRNILNRHAVLHGVKKDYARLKPSLQTFMLLDVLSELS